MQLALVQLLLLRLVRPQQRHGGVPLFSGTKDPWLQEFASCKPSLSVQDPEGKLWLQTEQTTPLRDIV